MAQVQHLTIALRGWRGTVIPLLAGFLALAGASASFDISAPPLTVSVVWSMLFPFIVAFAYGTRGAFLASLPTAAIPFLLWSNNGWACLPASLVYMSIIVGTGWLSGLRRKKLPLIGLLTFTLPALALLEILFFPPMMLLNPPGWAEHALTSIDHSILVGIAVKDMLTLFIYSLTAAHLVRIPFVRRLLGLNPLKEYRAAGGIFAVSFVTGFAILSVYTILADILVHQSLTIHAFPDLSKPPIGLAFLVNLAASLLAGLHISDFLARQRASEQELAATEKRKSAILAAIPDLLFILSRDGRFLDHVASQPEKLLIPPDRFIGQSIHDVLPPSIAIPTANAMEHVDEGEQRFTYTLDDGSVSRDYEARVIAWSTSEILIIIRDMTEDRHRERQIARLEAQLLQEQKLSAIGTLSGSVAHEINNPLMGIINLAQLILDNSEKARSNDPEIASLLGRVKEFSCEIISEGERIASIVRALLSVARQEESGMVPIQPVELIESVHSLVSKLFAKGDITMDVIIDSDAPAVFCNPAQIRQILLNLLTNARDAIEASDRHSPATSRITLHAQRHTDDQTWLRISITDTGDGIDASIVQQIYDPFFSTKARGKGTGLGLSVSKEIIEKHHGRISCETIQDEGTTFHVDLLAGPNTAPLQA